MNVPYFLDTNVLIYAISHAANHAAKKPVARQWFEREDWGVSTQVLMELYANAIKPQHQLPPERAERIVNNIVLQCPVQPLDATLVTQATRLSQRSQISLWDAAILCAARRLGAHTVISEDLNAGQAYEGVRVLNPFEDHAAS